MSTELKWLIRFAAVVLAFSIGRSFAGAESLRLGGRYSISEEQIQLSDPGATPLVLPCDVATHTLKSKGDFADYRPAWNGRAGVTEVLVHRWKMSQRLDDAVGVEVHHRGKVDVIRFDANTSADGWLSLGRFDFAGTPDEFVRLIRTHDADARITPALGVRFDVYYDTAPRPQTKAEQETCFMPGFETTGTWKSVGTESATSMMSVETRAAATWNPCLDEPGTYGVYVFKPNVDAGDVYEVWHADQIEHIDLRDVRQSNFELGNPRAKHAWYKLGEFHFDASGPEGLRVIKSQAGIETIAGDVYFEKVLLDGTLLHRTLVPASTLPGAELTLEKPPMSLDAKIAAGALPPGFSPQSPAEPSSKLGATVYARPLYLKSLTTPFRWNPCLTAPGSYEVKYFAYWPVKSDGEFRVQHQGNVATVPVKQADLKPGEFFSVGKFDFAGDGSEEFLEMAGLDRASEVVFERSLSGGRVLRQAWVTVHPYFREIRLPDTRDLGNAHDISFMIQKGVFEPIAVDRFAPEQAMTIEAFTRSLVKTVALRDKAAAEVVADLPAKYGWKVGDNILGYHASVLCEDALALSGRYANVSNFGNVNLASTLREAPELANVPAVHRFAIARLGALEIVPLSAANRAALMQPVSRAGAASLLKDFLEQGLSAGPPVDADWELSFQDEFNDDQVDWSKWKPRHVVRFKGYSAIWAENCSVRDGMLVLSNFMDNKLVPYSTASLTARRGQVHGFFEARHNYPDRAYGSHTSFWFSLGEQGDFNVNEGTYPNHISNNNYFMTSKEVPELKKGAANFNNFTIETNFAHDLHTISGYVDEANLFYALDGQVTYAVNNYPRYYADAKKSTNVPYAPIISSVITFFDGPLDRDRIDGSAVLVDWVRSYRKSAWIPSLVNATRLVDRDGRVTGVQLQFSKRMRMGSLGANAISVQSGEAELNGIAVEHLTPMKCRLHFPTSLTPECLLTLSLSQDIVDERGQPLIGESVTGVFQIPN